MICFSFRGKLNRWPILQFNHPKIHSKNEIHGTGLQIFRFLKSETKPKIPLASGLHTLRKCFSWFTSQYLSSYVYIMVVFKDLMFKILFASENQQIFHLIIIDFFLFILGENLTTRSKTKSNTLWCTKTP